MKHLLITLTLALATIAGVVAQPSRRSMGYMVYGAANTQNQYEDYFSIRTGVNFSNLVDDYYSSKAQTGFNAAILYNISLMSDAPLYLQSGLAVEMKGARNTNLLDNIYRSRLKSYEVELPVTITFDMPIAPDMGIVTEIGVYYSYVFCGSLEGTGEFYRPYKGQDIDVIDSGIINDRLLNRNDFGIRAGLSIRYSNTLIGVAYDAGLINAFGKELRDLGATLTTGTWSLNVGYRFK